MKNIGTIASITILVLGALLVYIRSQLGDTAALCFLFFLLGFFTAIVAVALGGRLNDQGQHAFIQGLSQLKTVMAPSMREQQRTEGYRERKEIEWQYRRFWGKERGQYQGQEQYEHR
jgi:hypothetical protein